MRIRRKYSFFVWIFSVAYLFSAIILILGVCGYCYPESFGWIKEIIVGTEDSPVRDAFNMLSDCLELGEPIKDALYQSVSVLIDNEG